MTLHRCDRCGQDFAIADDLTQLATKQKEANAISSSGLFVRVGEFCHNCMEQIRYFIKNPREEKDR